MDGFDCLGADDTSMGLALWTSREEAKAGIRAARTLQQLYAAVLKEHPDAVKYAPQVDPIIADADKWDDAWIFYQDSEAVEIGRRAQVVAQQISAEYKKPVIASDPALGPGLAEHLQDKGKEAADKGTEALDTIKKALPWIVGGVAVAIVVPIAAPLIVASAAGRGSGR